MLCKRDIATAVWDRPGGVPLVEQSARLPDPNPSGSARRAAHRARSRHLAAAAMQDRKAPAQGLEGFGGFRGAGGTGSQSASACAAQPAASPAAPQPPAFSVVANLASQGATSTPAAAPACTGYAGVWGFAGLGGAVGGTAPLRSASPAECSPMDWAAPTPAVRYAWVAGQRALVHHLLGRLE